MSLYRIFRATTPYPVDNQAPLFRAGVVSADTHHKILWFPRRNILQLSSGYGAFTSFRASLKTGERTADQDFPAQMAEAAKPGDSVQRFSTSERAFCALKADRSRLATALAALRRVKQSCRGESQQRQGRLIRGERTSRLWRELTRDPKAVGVCNPAPSNQPLRYDCRVFMATVARRTRAAHRHAGADTIERASLNVGCLVVRGERTPPEKHLADGDLNRGSTSGSAPSGGPWPNSSANLAITRQPAIRYRFSVGGLRLLPACDESSATSSYTAESLSAATHSPIVVDASCPHVPEQTRWVSPSTFPC